jgi:phosphoglycolate phosphatase-like HAD superfamily hydrolase
LVWGEYSEFDTIVEIFVRLKISILDQQITTDWPKPMPHFMDLRLALKARGKGFGLLTAGHELFIRSAFAAQDCEPPNMLTDDDIRGTRWAGTQKPNPLLLELFLEKFHPTIRPQKEQILFLGDDIVRDGELARNAGVAFGLYSPYRIPAPHELWPGAFTFAHYRDLIHALGEEGLQAAE